MLVRLAAHQKNQGANRLCPHQAGAFPSNSDLQGLSSMRRAGRWLATLAAAIMVHNQLNQDIFW